MVLDPSRGQEATKLLRAIAGSVVGHDPLDRDAQGLVPRHGPLSEIGGRLLALVGQGLGLGNARAVVNGDVEVVVTESADPAFGHPVLVRVVVPGAHQPAMHPPTTPIRDAGLLLDIDVDQLSRPLPLVADHRLGGAVDVAESRQLFLLSTL
jgi:hypothetical protein